MSRNNKKGRASLTKKWTITLIGFVIMQTIFIIIDDTFLEPNLNLMGNFAHSLVNTHLFTEYITLYENPYFKIITFLAVLHIVFTSIKDIVVHLIPNRN
ncbi:YfzA family protein [Terribacillus sp. DMT04]|uniref:YfzA family protein n=1 Tax=Terribacillus sp. DMT04 TaxID=2850441 RepID=UPI001C2C508A|nr:YfzA family protein [Terribacillus sp. DMT04]QXE03226.1 YfzA family protein [Terribacillus sp. DMT04]